MTLMEATLFKSLKRNEARAVMRRRRRKGCETKRAQKRMRTKLHQGREVARLTKIIAG